MHTRGEEPGRIGLVADLANPMWDETVLEPKYRCLIPITHFANPDSDAGAKTRTWFSVKQQPIVAWAGFCRSIPDMGHVYAGMTMEANGAIPPAIDRMPFLLETSARRSRRKAKVLLQPTREIDAGKSSQAHIGAVAIPGDSFCHPQISESMVGRSDRPGT